MNDTVELRRIVGVLARRWWLILILTLLGAAAGYFWSGQQEKVYSATTSVIVGQAIQATNLDSRDIQTSERLALTYADLAKRQPVLQRTVEALDLDDTWKRLSRKVDVRLVPDTQLLEITVEDSTKEDAIRIADELARQLRDLSPASLRNRKNEPSTIFVTQRPQDLQATIESGKERLVELRAELVATTNSEERTQLQTEISGLEQIIIEWEETFANLPQDSSEVSVKQRPQDLEASIDTAGEKLVQLEEQLAAAATDDEKTEIQAEINALEGMIVLWQNAFESQQDESSAVFVQQRLQDLQTRIENGNEQILGLESRLADITDADERFEIVAEINDLESIIVEWENTYAKFLDLGGNTESANYIYVIDQAHARFTPVRPNVQLNTIIAGIVGLVMAFGIIFVLEVLDDTLKTEDDIIQDLNLTPLGKIGRFVGQDFREQMVVSKDPFSPMSESYRMIRNNIQFMSIDEPTRTIMITSPGPGEGKSATAINLAVAMANTGNNTILVDCDLRKPVLHEAFRLPNGRGLSDQFRSSDPGEDINLWETEVVNLQLLTAGEDPPNPSELLGSHRMKQIIDRLAEQVDVIIFDSPPAAYVADAAALSKHVDGVLFVVSAGETRRDVAKRAVFNLQKAGATIYGVVLNRTSEKGGRYEYRYKYYPSPDKWKRALGRIRAASLEAWGLLPLEGWWKKERTEG